MNEVRLLPFGPEHIPEAVEIEKSAFSVPWTCSDFAEIISNPYAVYFAAVRGGILVGYAGMYLAEESGEIHNIAVELPYRGTGIGGILMKALIDRAVSIGAKWLTLEVRPSNQSAMKLYLAHNFRSVGVRKGYYSHPKEDGIIMRLDL